MWAKFTNVVYTSQTRTIILRHAGWGVSETTVYLYNTNFNESSAWMYTVFAKEIKYRYLNEVWRLNVAKII